ncbi:MAG: hypothetical protein IKN64_07210 [Desulfovibrio sp.]|nr:hypothetical protein [Desulfovibrio sp.]
MSQEEKTVEAGADKAVQLPMVLNHSHIPSDFANVFQTRIVDGLVAISYGVSYPDTATDANGQKQPVYAVELERRLVMKPDSAKRLYNVLAQTLKQFEEAEK